MQQTLAVRSAVMASSVSRAVRRRASAKGGEFFVAGKPGMQSARPEHRDRIAGRRESLGGGRVGPQLSQRFLLFVRKLRQVHSIANAR